VAAAGVRRTAVGLRMTVEDHPDRDGDRLSSPSSQGLISELGPVPADDAAARFITDWAELEAARRGCSARTGTGHIGLNANTPVSHLGLSQDNLLRLHS
jgi:hypothetical protein